MLSDQVKSFDITWRIKCDLLGKLHYGPAYNPAAVSCPDWLCQQCRPCLASGTPELQAKPAFGVDLGRCFES